MNRIAHAFGDNQPTREAVARDFVGMYAAQWLNQRMPELAADIGDLMQSVGLPIAAIELTPSPDWVRINLLKEGMPLGGEE